MAAARGDQRRAAVIALASVLVGAGLVVPGGAYVASRFQQDGDPTFVWWPNPIIFASVAVLVAGLLIFSSLIFGWPISTLTPDLHEAKTREQRNFVAQRRQALVVIRERTVTTEEEAKQQREDGETFIRDMADWLEVNRSTADREIFVNFVNLPAGDSSRARYAKMDRALENLNGLLESWHQ